jgi:hypothetical protein
MSALPGGELCSTRIVRSGADTLSYGDLSVSDGHGSPEVCINELDGGFQLLCARLDDARAQAGSGAGGIYGAAHTVVG